MKKTLLLSVVASTMIMAGGDISPVEPVVEVPSPASSMNMNSDWNFAGQGVVYYQTTDNNDIDLFDQDASRATAGVQLRATNKNIVAGIGAGVEVSGVSTLNLESEVVSGVMQGAGDHLKGGWVSQAYLTYGIGNTSISVGRQTLPKSLSPFAFSEDWNVFHNTFDSVLVVNTDLPDTTLAGAWILRANYNETGANMSHFRKLNQHDGVYMLTAQNKSIDGLTLTGTGYYGANVVEKKIWLSFGEMQNSISLTIV